MKVFRNKLLWFLVGAFLFRVFFAFYARHPDVLTNIDWGQRFWVYGPGEFYTQNVWNFTWPNQPPGNVLIFAAVRKLFEGIFALFWLININISIFPSGIISYFELNLYPALAQLPGILGDFGIAYLIYRILKEWKNKKVARFGVIIFLVNPALWFNSSFWGQTDSVVNFFGLLAFWLLWRGKLPWAIAVFFVSLYIKVSLVIFAPIFIIVLWKKFSWRDILIASVPTVLWVGVITLPFSTGTNKDPFTWLYFLYKDKILAQQLHVITANAFNFWGLVAGMEQRPNDLPLLFLTYEKWSYVLFGVFYAPVLYFASKVKREAGLYWVLATTSLLVWMLLTNMHERYIYPFFVYFTVLAAQDKRLLPIYWAMSGVSLINLHNMWFVPKIGFWVKLMEGRGKGLQRVFSGVNVVLLGVLYRKFILRLKD